MRFTIAWIYQGRLHEVRCNEQITAGLVARAVSERYRCEAFVNQGMVEVARYENGEIR